MIWTTLLVTGPLLAGVVAVMGGRRTSHVGLALGSIASLLGSGGLWWTVRTLGPVHHPLGGWGAPLGLELRADGLGVAMLAVTAVVGTAISLYAAAWFAEPTHLRPGETPSKRGESFFAPLWLFLWAALNGIYLSGDVFNLYVTLEILGLSAAAMVTLAGTSQAIEAGMRYLLVSLVGSMFFLVGVVILYLSFGILSLDGLAGMTPSGPLPATALAAMTVGLSMKTALLPFHGWLPPAHGSAPAPGSALLSGLVVKGSFYILLRIWMEVFGGGTRAGLLVLGCLGGLAIFWGSILALRQVSLKRLVAFSTVAQLGYLLVLFPLLVPGAGGWSALAWEGGLYHALSHAVAKAAMFLAAGSMILAVGRDALPSLAGAARQLPLSFVAFGVAGFSLAGIPPSGGFVSKWLMLRSAAVSGQWGWALVIAGGSLLTVAYVLLVLRWGLRRPERDTVLRPVPRRIEWTALGLALLTVLMGLRSTEILTLVEGQALSFWR